MDKIKIHRLKGALLVFECNGEFGFPIFDEPNLVACRANSLREAVGAFSQDQAETDEGGYSTEEEFVASWEPKEIAEGDLNRAETLFFEFAKEMGLGSGVQKVVDLGLSDQKSATSLN